MIKLKIENMKNIEQTKHLKKKHIKKNQIIGTI